MTHPILTVRTVTRDRRGAVVDETHELMIWDRAVNYLAAVVATGGRREITAPGRWTIHGNPLAPHGGTVEVAVDPVELAD